MRRLPAHRWFVIALLFFRAVLGDAAHAMTMQSMVTMPEATSSMAQHCEGQTTMSADDSRVSVPEPPVVSNGHSHDHDAAPCCETGACECPCLHVPILTTSIAMNADPVVLDRHDTDRIMPLPRERLANLFRPPIL